MNSDELGFLTLSDTEKTLLAEVKEAVLAAENSGAFDDAAACSTAASTSLSGSNVAVPNGWEHPAAHFLASTFVRKCLTQLEVLRAHGVAYSLKELVWFVLNLERDPSYMLGLTGSDCTEEQVRSLADRMPRGPAISVPPEPLLLVPDESMSTAGSGAADPADAANDPEPAVADNWPTVQEALVRLRQLAEAASAAADDERRRPRRGYLPVERPTLTLTLPELPEMPPSPLDPAGSG